MLGSRDCLTYEKNMKTNKKWYADGLHFECTGCGRCCMGPEEGHVWITNPEMKMMADFLGMSEEDMRKKYCRKVGNRTSLTEQRKTKDCIFLTDGQCPVYQVRPNQCRTWPFWSSNLYHPGYWNMAGMTCPGINRGRHYTFEEIEELRLQKKWWE